MRLGRFFQVFPIASLVASAALAQSTGPVFQPGFHQALRSSMTTSMRTTYRMKLPIGRAGSRIRLAFKAGDGSLTLHSATVAVAGSQGVLLSPPRDLTFGDLPGFTTGPRSRVTSDPVSFEVAFGQELYVSFDVEGALAVSDINAFPDSYSWSGSHTRETNPPAGTPFMQAVGLDTIDVEAGATTAFVALGDSITEGYVSGDVWAYVSKNDDYRGAWTTITQGLLGLPVANAGVNGQGVDQAIAALGSEVFTLQGITDCIVLLGTNNLGTWTADQIEARLAALFDQLRPFCHVWAGTLLPKERTPNGTYSDVVSRRVAVNDWIRHQAAVDGTIDFEAVLAATGNMNLFAPGLGSDGIHPSIAGQSAMGHEAARVLAHAPEGSDGGTIQPPPSNPSSPGSPPPSVSSPSATGCNASGVVPSLLALMPLFAFFRRRAALS